MHTTPHTTIIYAAYLPGSTTPDYIGSHASNPPARNYSLQWRYAHLRYLGQGAWIDPEGLLHMPTANHATKWGRLLASMSAAERLAIRIETLSIVPTPQRWKAEAVALRTYKPPYNVMLPQTAQSRKAKWAAYQRAYRPTYMQTHPEKLQAKRLADKLRIRAKRAAQQQEEAQRSGPTDILV